MNNAMKGALLSGLIVPGLGQIILKHYIRGTVLMLTVLGGLAILVIKTVQLALLILEKYLEQGGAFTFAAISKAAAHASMNLGSFSFSLLFFLIIACWIIAVIDAYTIGRKMDRAISSTADAKATPSA